MSKEMSEEEKKTLEEVEGRFTEVFRWFFKTYPEYPSWFLPHGRTKTAQQEEE